MKKYLLFFSLIFLSLQSPVLAGDGAGTMPGKIIGYVDGLGFLKTFELTDLFKIMANLEQSDVGTSSDVALAYHINEDGVFVLEFNDRVLLKFPHQEFQTVYGTTEAIFSQNPVDLEPAQIFFDQARDLNIERVEFFLSQDLGVQLQSSQAVLPLKVDHKLMINPAVLEQFDYNLIDVDAPGILEFQLP